MKPDGRRGTPVSFVRALAQALSTAELEHCLAEQIEAHKNSCVVCADHALSVDLLARATYVRNRVDGAGVTLNQALRDLGRRMRRVYEFKGPREVNRHRPGKLASSNTGAAGSRISGVGKS